LNDFFHQLVFVAAQAALCNLPMRVEPHFDGKARDAIFLSKSSVSFGKSELFLTDY
jgi:hypothetical protein